MASIQTDRLLYTAAKAPKAPYRNVPADVLGVSTVAFAPAASLPPTAFPQGHGVGVLTVAASGRAALVGKVADGAAMSYSNAVSVGKKFPVYLTYSLPKGAVGTLSGWVPLDNPTAQDDFEATLRWLRPATASPTYPAGWPTGIPLQLQGSRWLPKGPSGQPIRFPVLKSANVSGNVVFRFTEGLLPGTGRKPRFEAVILQKRQRAVGFFTTPGVSGRVEVAPR